MVPRVILITPLSTFAKRKDKNAIDTWQFIAPGDKNSQHMYFQYKQMPRYISNWFCWRWHSSIEACFAGKQKIHSEIDFTFASIHTSDAWNTQTQSVSDSRNPGLNVVTYQIEWKMIRKIHEFVVKIIANLPAVENWTKKPSKKTTKLLLLLAISVSPCSRRAYNVGCGPYTNRIVISSVARIFRFVRSYAWIIFGAFHTHTSSRCVIKMTENGDERTRTRIKLK